jgi:4-amino-4-deoxy-L-arabinose transferase-like glycosyltransferase
MPYRDIHMMNMPLTILVHILAITLFGRTMTAIRILDLFWTIATASLVSLVVVKALRRPWLGLVAGLSFSFIYYSNSFWNTAQVDGFLNLPLAGAMCLLVSQVTRDAHQDHSWPAWFAAGILIGIALFFKFTVGALLPASALVVGFAFGWRSTRTWSAILWLGGGCLLILLGGLLVVARSGALPDLIAGLTKLALPYSRVRLFTARTLLERIVEFPDLPRTAMLVAWLGVLGVIPSLALLLGKLPESSPPARRGVALILAWFAAALVSLLLQGKLFTYHYLPLIPPLAILGALVVAMLLRPLADYFVSIWSRIAVVGVALLGLVLSSAYRERLLDTARVAAGRVSLRQVWSGFQLGQFWVQENLQLADYLAGATRPDERVANFGIDPPFTFPAWREPVTVWDPDPRFSRGPVSFRERLPDVLTVKHDERLPWVTGDSLDAYEQLQAIPVLRKMVADSYVLETRIGHFDVLRKRTTQSSGISR